MSESPATLPHMVCLGCGCTCDDIEVGIRDGRIVEARHACERGAAWFGDGVVPARARVDGADADVDAAVAAAADRLSGAGRPLVYLAPDITCDTQRASVALADRLRAAIDSITSAAGLRAVLAAQERGRAGATLGEIRHRADLLVFWAVDPAVRYPRFCSRYALDPEGLQVGGRTSRTVIAVDIGGARGPAQADRRIAVAPSEELDLLTALTAALQRDTSAADAGAIAALAPQLEELVPLLTGARYAALVTDGEAGDADDSAAGGGRADGIIAVTHALNAATRAAAVVLRDGGNRSGADAVLTWQTGFPAAVEFSRGYPRYRPYDGTASMRLDARRADVVLVVGAAAGIPGGVAARMAATTTIVIGPRATESPLAARGVAIDTGVAGIHESGMALRMDDVPLPLRAVLPGPPATEAIVRALTGRIVTNRGL